MTVRKPATEQVLDAVVAAVRPEHDLMVDDQWQLLSARRVRRALVLTIRHPDGTTREHVLCQTSQGTV